MKCYAKIFLPHITKNNSGYARYEMNLKLLYKETFTICATRSCSPIGQNLSHHVQYHDPAIFYVFCHLPSSFVTTFAYGHCLISFGSFSDNKQF